MSRELVFVISKPTFLYEKMDANFLHPERIETIKKLQDMEKNGIIEMKQLTKIVKNIKKRSPENEKIILPCIELADIQRDYGLINVKQRTIKDAGTSTIFCEGNNILFSRLRPYLNKVALIPPSIKQAICSGEFFVFSRIDKTIPLGYLWLVLRSNFILNQSIHLPTGSLRPRIDEDDLSDIIVPLIVDKKRIKEIDTLVQKGLGDYFSASKNLNTVESNYYNSISLPPLSKPPKLFFAMSNLPSDCKRPSYRMDPLFFHSHYYDNLKQILHKWAKDQSGEIKELEDLAISIVRWKSKVRGKIGSTPRLGVTNVTNRDILWDCDYVDVEFHQNNFMLQKNDLLISSTGIGSTCKVEIYDEKQPAITDGHITIIRLKPDIDPYFLLVYLRSEYGQRQLARMERGTSGQIEIYADDVKKLLVPFHKNKKFISKAKQEIKNMSSTIINAKKKLNEAMYLLDASFKNEKPIDFKKLDTAIPKKEWRISR